MRPSGWSGERPATPPSRSAKGSACPPGRSAARYIPPVRLAAVIVLAGLLLAGGRPAGGIVRPGDDRLAQIAGGGPDVRSGGGGLLGGPDAPAAVAALRRASAAGRSTSYDGREFVTVWNPGSTLTEWVDVTNIPGQGTAVRTRDRRAESGAEQPAAFVAPGPDDAAQSATLTGPAAGRLSALIDAYSLRVVGQARARTAGRPATVVDARRANGSNAARFWIDNASGLLLRRELYAPDGSIARASGFTHVRIGTDSSGPPLPPVLATRAAELVGPASYDDLSRRGWDCCAPYLAGGFVLYDVSRTDSGSALRLSYSDGLTTVSVFEQRGRLDESADSGLDGFTTKQVRGTEVHLRYGLSSYAIWARNGLVYTVVCDTPHSLDAVVTAFPHDRSGPDGTGLVQRLDRGMGRMVSWLNPFD